MRYRYYRFEYSFPRTFLLNRELSNIGPPSQCGALPALARAKLGDTPILLLTPDFDDGKAAIAATQSQRRRI